MHNMFQTKVVKPPRVLHHPTHYVYLAGVISGMTYREATAWRDEVQEMFLDHVIGLSPLRTKGFFDQDHVNEDSYEHLFATEQAITARDRFDCCRADMILMNLLGAPKVSIGSMIELGWADANRIPIVVVMDEQKMHDHPMVRDIASWVVHDLPTAVTIINGVLG